MTNENGMGGISICGLPMQKPHRGLLWRWRGLKMGMFTCSQGASPTQKQDHSPYHSRGAGGDTAPVCRARLHPQCQELPNIAWRGLPTAPRSAAPHLCRQQGWGWDVSSLQRARRHHPSDHPRQILWTSPSRQTHFCRVPADLVQLWSVAPC